MKWQGEPKLGVLPTNQSRSSGKGNLPSIAQPNTNEMMLLMSGDIESNPGPSCNRCFKNIPTSKKGHLQCHNCKHFYHKKTTCSLLKRQDVEKILNSNEEWNCSICRNEAEDRNNQDTVDQGEVDDLREQPIQQQPAEINNPLLCGHFDANLRRGTVPLVSQEQGCSVKCHSKIECSGISRYSKTK